MRNLRDARIFVESLNVDQRRALAYALFLDPMDEENLPALRAEYQLDKLAGRLCEVVILARTVRHITNWETE